MTESLSDTTKITVGKEVSSLDVSPQFEAYSGVEIIVSDEISYFAGNRNGRVLTIQNPWGTQAQATAILNSLKAKGFQYQPYTADGVILNPAAEIGDGITISDTYSGIYKISRNYTPLMAADVEAPQDEEIDHEYPYEPKQDRVYKREIAEAKAEISINSDAITAEVSRASTAEGNLSSRITQNANSITSEVTARKNADNNLSTRITQNATSISTEVSQRKAADNTLTQSISTLTQTANNISATVSSVNSNKLDHTRSNSSFGWDLTATAFKINSSGSKNVFTATKDGIVIQGNATVTGKIQATSGFIGSSASNGFTIRNTGISYGTVNANGDDLAIDSETGKYVNGVFISRSKIRLGNNFYVTNSGYVEAKNLAIRGGSIILNDADGNEAFHVYSSGRVDASNLNLKGGSINLKRSSDNATIFSVKPDGTVSAVNMRLSGTLTVGGATISADSLRQGAEKANSGYSNWNSAYTSTSAGGYCYGGASGGYAFDNASNKSGGRTYFNAGHIYTGNLHASAISSYTVAFDGTKKLTSTSFSVNVPSIMYVYIDGSKHYVTVERYSTISSGNLAGWYYMSPLSD